MIPKDQSKINLELQLSYVLLNKLLSEKLSNIELRKGLIVQSASIQYDTDHLVMAINVNGLMESTIHAHFNITASSGKLLLNDFSVKLGSGGFFGSGINFMIERWFKSNLQTRIQDIIHDKLLLLTQMILNEEKQIPLPEGLQLSLTIESLEIVDAITLPEALKFFIFGNAILKIKG